MESGGYLEDEDKNNSYRNKMNKFMEYYSSPEKTQELSEYVHMNLNLIYTKMLSEMRIKLDIKPDMKNSDGYVSLMISLCGFMFGEMLYNLAGISQATDMKFSNIISKTTINFLLDLLVGNNPLNGNIRTDVKEDLEGFKKYYFENIEEIRKNIDALPKG